MTARLPGARGSNQYQSRGGGADLARSRAGLGDAARAVTGTGAAPRPMFPLGQAVATPGVAAHLQRCGADAGVLLLRHAQGDWGDISDDDAAKNQFGVRTSNRVVSVYTVGREQIFVITDDGHDLTTLLFSSEY